MMERGEPADRELLPMEGGFMNNRKRWGVWVFLVFISLVWFSPALGAEAKNVILLIGDGMGPQAAGLAIYYNRFINGPGKFLNMERLMAAGNTGYCLTYQYGTVVTDSASAATALAAGVKTRDAIVDEDPCGYCPPAWKIHRRDQQYPYHPRHTGSLLRQYHSPGYGE
jgi:alkaline phosphatase